MARRLSQTKVTQMERALDRAHELIHRIQHKTERVTSVSLKEIAAKLRDTSNDLDILAASPFLAVQPDLREPRK